MKLETNTPYNTSIIRYFNKPIWSKRQLSQGIVNSFYPSYTPAIHSIGDLKQHNAIAYRQLSNNKKVAWQLRQQPGSNEIIQIHPNASLSVSNIDAAKTAALHGFGITAMGSWNATQCVKSGTLIPILRELWPDERAIWMYYMSKDYLPKRVRLLIEFITKHFDNH